MIHYRHLVLSQSTGLVRAYYLSAAESLNGSQLTDDGVSLTHVGNAYRKYDSNDPRQDLQVSPLRQG